MWNLPLTTIEIYTLARHCVLCLRLLAGRCISKAVEELPSNYEVVFTQVLFKSPLSTPVEGSLTLNYKYVCFSVVGHLNTNPGDFRQLSPAPDLPEHFIDVWWPRSHWSPCTRFSTILLIALCLECVARWTRRLESRWNIIGKGRGVKLLSGAGYTAYLPPPQSLCLSLFPSPSVRIYLSPHAPSHVLTPRPSPHRPCIYYPLSNHFAFSFDRLLLL